MTQAISNSFENKDSLSLLKNQESDLHIYRGDIYQLDVDCVVCGMPMCKKCDEHYADTNKMMHPYCIHIPSLHINKEVSQNHIDTLKLYYKHALQYADSKGMKSIAFCTKPIDMIPSDMICKAAVDAVKEYKHETESSLQVVFCVKKDMDEILCYAYMNE